MVDLLLDLEVPVFFFLLILFTKEFFFVAAIGLNFKK